MTISLFTLQQDANAGFNTSIHEAIRTIFPSDLVSVASLRQVVDIDKLYPEEVVYVQNAVSKRVREFATGRHCAREALTRIGYSLCSIGMRKDGAPQWPTGIVGSISHTSGCVVAAVAQNRGVGAIGVDVERINPDINENIWNLVCDNEEKKRLKTLHFRRRLIFGYALFSAKESVIKCLYPHCNSTDWPGFRDIRIDLDLAAGQFLATVQNNKSWQWIGRINTNEHYVYSGIWLSKMVLDKTTKQ